MRSISETYISKLQENNIANGLDIVKIRYAIAVLKSELIKTILLIGIFASIGQLEPFMIVMLLILPIRLSTGGVHFQRNVPCFLFSLGYFLLVVCILPLVKMDLNFLYCLLGLGVLVTAICPLAPSKKRPIVSRKKYLQNKYFSLIYLVAFSFIVLILLKDQELMSVCIGALFIHGMELLFLKLYKGKDDEHV